MEQYYCGAGILRSLQRSLQILARFLNSKKGKECDRPELYANDVAEAQAPQLSFNVQNGARAFLAARRSSLHTHLSSKSDPRHSTVFLSVSPVSIEGPRRFEHVLPPFGSSGLGRLHRFRVSRGTPPV